MSAEKASVQVHIADMMKGGDGAAQYMQQVAGDMNNQVADANGVLKYTPVSGGGLEQVAVPALLVLANNVAPKLVKRGGSSMKKSRGRRRGRKGGHIDGDDNSSASGSTDANPVVGKLPVVSTDANPVVGKLPVVSTDANPVVDELPVVLPALVPTEENVGKTEVADVPAKTKFGGNMLQQAIVPATLILASNMLGKKGMRKMSSFTKRRSSRRRNNRRKRVSRRFRRGTR